jgi:hypothetical protein
MLAMAVCAALASACSSGTEPGGGNGDYDHARAPGASARDLLTADDFDSLLVQVQYVQGFAPTAQGLQHLEDFLEARLHKPGGVTVEVGLPLPSPGRATHTTAQVRAMQQQYRSAYTEGRTLALHLLYLDGEYDGAPNVLGIAYANTSMAIFAEKIQQHTGGVLQPSFATVEGTVAQHEVGHLLGLVNNGTPMQAEHQDEPNGSHCDDPDCLMHYAVRTTDFIQNLLGGMPTLDPDCLADLAANGGR